MEFISQVNPSAKNNSGPFKVLVYRPKGRLSRAVQGIWTTTVDHNACQPVKHGFHADAYSSLVFNLGPVVSYNGSLLEQNIVLLPAKQEASLLSLPPGSRLAGIRFQPGVARAIFGKICSSTSKLSLPQCSQSIGQLYGQLDTSTGPNAQLRHLYQWLLNAGVSTYRVPTQLQAALDKMQAMTPVADLAESMQLSQRQLERQFRWWIGMTPKRYQRTLRVNNTVRQLSRQPDANLCDLAVNYGYADQAHMTREFKLFTQTSPKRFGQKILEGER